MHIHCRVHADGTFHYRVWDYDHHYVTPPMSRVEVVAWLTQQCEPCGASRFERAERRGTSVIQIGDERCQLNDPWLNAVAAGACMICQSFHGSEELVDYCLRLDGAHDYGDDT